MTFKASSFRLFRLSCSTATRNGRLRVLTHVTTMCRPIAVTPVSLFRLRSTADQLISLLTDFCALIITSLVFLNTVSSLCSQVLAPTTSIVSSTNLLSSMFAKRWREYFALLNHSLIAFIGWLHLRAIPQAPTHTTAGAVHAWGMSTQSISTDDKCTVSPRLSLIHHSHSTTHGISSSSSDSLSSSSSLRLGSIPASPECPAGVRLTSLSLRRFLISNGYYLLVTVQNPTSLSSYNFPLITLISSSLISLLPVLFPGIFSSPTLICSTSLTGYPSIHYRSSLVLPSANGIPVPFSFPYVLSLPLAFSTTETWESVTGVQLFQSLPSIRVSVVSFGVVYLSHARTGDSSAFPGPFSFSVGDTSVLTRLSLVYGLPLLYTTEPCARTHHKSCSSAPKTLFASIVCRTVAGPMPTILASPAHQPISAHNADPRLSYWELSQPPSPLPLLLSGPVSVLHFHHYFCPSGVPTYTPHSIPNPFAGPRRLYSCGQADRPPLQNVAPQVPVTQRVHIHIGNKP
ncbi:unnamed protein product [Acanthosepion pharaonis]|uniref:Uncharacterized protein n=1 Tax=Acanthosepion pharaonis TaxID=158019 RepID=A0A812D2S0_ACAPH|nr:unnamed protein product [Sepia pharaonis]